MSFTVKIEGIEELRASLSDLQQNQFPFAMAKSLTKVAQEVKIENVNVMQRVFDKPTPYTLNALWVKTATKVDLFSRVYLKEEFPNPAEHYLRPQIFGTFARPYRKFEAALYWKGILPKDHYIVPGQSCPLDQYGNISRSFIIQIMSYFQAFGEQGYTSNITEKRKRKLSTGGTKAGVAYAGYTYFVARENDGSNLHPGIWKRTGLRWAGKVEPIMMFVRRAIYEKRFPFYETGEKVFDDRWRTIFDQALQDALNTAK